MRTLNSRTPNIALNWTIPGKEKSGKTSDHLDESSLAELREVGYKWDRSTCGKDKDKWRKLVAALHPTNNE